MIILTRKEHKTRLKNRNEKKNKFRNENENILLNGIVA